MNERLTVLEPEILEIQFSESWRAIASNLWPLTYPAMIWPYLSSSQQHLPNKSEGNIMKQKIRGRRLLVNTGDLACMVETYLYNVSLLNCRVITVLTSMTYHDWTVEWLVSSTGCRTFYLSHNHGGCDNDAGWLAITGQTGCGCDSWDKTGTVPKFLYSASSNYINWSQHSKCGCRVPSTAPFIAFPWAIMMTTHP